MKKVLLTILTLIVLLGLSVTSTVPLVAASATNPQVQTLFAGQDIDVGTVSVWNDADDLFVEYATTGGWEIFETHLAVGSSLDEIPQTKKDNPIPGQFDYKNEHDPSVTTFTYTVPLPDDWFTDRNNTMFIAAHAVVMRPIDGCWETVWQIGDVEGRDPASGLLYNYADEFNWGDPAGPTTMGPGLAVEAPAFTDPFIVGTTPTGEFPYNSNASFPYATDFNVQWDGELPFGGQLTISWSPGASASETKIIGDGINSESFSASGASRPGEGWFMDKYALVQNAFAMDPVEDGTHAINFQHTQGDGTFWDWILLEKPCVQEETAWADGLDFAGKNWATYFTYNSELSVEEACALIRANEGNADFHIFDVRKPAEFFLGHIEGAVNLTYSSSAPEIFEAAVDVYDKDGTYLVYCKSDYRGYRAVEIMIDLGFTDVHNMDGGYLAWIGATGLECDSVDLAGTWLLSVNTGTYTHDMLISIDSPTYPYTGTNPTVTISGTGGYPAGSGPPYDYPYNWTMTGSFTGPNITMTLDYESTYTATITGTIAGDLNSMSGGAGTGGVVNWEATRVP